MQNASTYHPSPVQVGGEETSASERLTWRQALQTRVHTLGITAFRMAVHGLVQDVHENLEDDQRMVAMHQAAEIFEPRAELVFKYLQVRGGPGINLLHLLCRNDVSTGGAVAAVAMIPMPGLHACKHSSRLLITYNNLAAL